MKLRSTIGAFAIAGALTMGAAAPALAETPPERPPRACVAAREVLQELRQVNRQVTRQLRHLQAAIDRAEAQGYEQLAARLQAKHDRLEAQQDRVQARVQRAAERVRDLCTPDTPAEP